MLRSSRVRLEAELPALEKWLADCDKAGDDEQYSKVLDVVGAIEFAVGNLGYLEERVFGKE